MAVALAGAVPLIALTTAARAARSEVRTATFAGSTATATAVASLAGQEYATAVDTLARGRSAPTVLSALQGSGGGGAAALVPRFMAAGPYDAFALYGAGGALLAGAPSSAGEMPRPEAGKSGDVVEGPLVARGAQTLRRVTVPVADPSTGAALGALVADVDLSRLITDQAALRFQQTGVSKLVGTNGRVLLSPDGDNGRELLAAANRAMARAHRPRTLSLFTPFYNRRSVEAYVPVAGQPFGVLTQQSEAEAFAGIRHLDRRLRQLEGAFVLLGLSLGTTIAVVVARRDTRIRAQTDDLAAAQALFRSAFDDAPSGAALVDPEGRHLEVNAALCAITGYSHDELLNRTVADITHPDDREEAERLAARATAGEIGEFDLEKRYVRSDGEVVWVHVRSSAVHNERRTTHFIRHVVDVTKQHQAAEALRTALEREQRAADELRRLDQTRMDLLATVTHDFRSPLTAARGFAELLIEDWDRIDDDRRTEMLERITANLERLDQRVTEFLDSTRPDRSSVALHLGPCDLAAVTHAVLDRSGTLVADHEVRTAIPAGMTVWANDDALVRVLENLLSNAGKYAPAHTTVAITATRADGNVVVSVDDEGPGIPPEKADRIFERYYRVDDGDPATPGTGLGLAAVRQLLIAMGGHVWFERRPTGGSSFRFALPSGPPDSATQPTSGARGTAT
jgi:PAS domain S-box-containing protein